jgi:hypothetical protein
MLTSAIGRLIVVSPARPLFPIGYLGRKELILGRRRRLQEEQRESGWLEKRRRSSPQ